MKAALKIHSLPTLTSVSLQLVCCTAVFTLSVSCSLWHPFTSLISILASQLLSLKCQIVVLGRTIPGTLVFTSTLLTFTADDTSEEYSRVAFLVRARLIGLSVYQFNALDNYRSLLLIHPLRKYALSPINGRLRYVFWCCLMEIYDRVYVAHGIQC